MPTLTAQWDTVVGAYGYRIHAGLVSTIYTHVSADIPADTVPDVAGNTKSGSVTVPTVGTWFYAVSAYDISGYEGPYSVEQSQSLGETLVDLSWSPVERDDIYRLPPSTFYLGQHLAFHAVPVIPGLLVFSYYNGELEYTYTHISGDVPTEFRIHWGYQGAGTPYTHVVASGVYNVIVPYPDFLPGEGNYQLYVTASDGVSEWAASSVVIFTLTTADVDTSWKPIRPDIIFRRHLISYDGRTSIGPLVVPIAPVPKPPTHVLFVF